MSKTTVTLCDICEKSVATIKCFVCKRDMCDKHNFGGKHSSFTIAVWIYNNNFCDESHESTNIADVCGRCSDTLKRQPFKIPQEAIDIIQKEIDTWKDSFNE